MYCTYMYNFVEDSHMLLFDELKWPKRAIREIPIKPNTLLMAKPRPKVCGGISLIL